MINLTDIQKRVFLFMLVLSGILYFIFMPLFFIAIGGALLVLSSLTIAMKIEKVLHLIGRINSTILLGVFFFLILTPFSLLYKSFWRSENFKKKSDSSFCEKKEISDFSLPF